MKILLSPQGSHGDIHPFAGLGLALKQRGHDVLLLANAHFEPMAKRFVLDFLPVADASAYDQAIQDPDLWHPRRGFGVVASVSMIDPMREVYRAIVERYQPGETAVIASAVSIGARLAQEKLGVPLATIHLQPAMVRSIAAMPQYQAFPLHKWLPKPARLALYWLIDRVAIDPVIVPELNRFRAELNLPPIHRAMLWWDSPERIITAFPEWYAPRQADWPPQLRFADFPLFDESQDSNDPPELTDFLNQGEPPIVFTFGSAMSQAGGLFRESIEACRILGARGLLLARHDAQIPSDLPDFVRHFEYVPLSRILPLAKAVAHHGGVGTMAQAMKAGIPQLICPMAHDQFDNAARCRRLGIAASLPRRLYRAGEAARRLKGLLDSPGVAQACRLTAAQFVKADGLSRMADEVEAWMASRTDARSPATSTGRNASPIEAKAAQAS